MRRSQLRSSSTLKRTGPLARRTRLRPRGDTKYRRRERDVPRMLWTKRQPCMVRELPPSTRATACSGPVEADHMGARGMGQKADDSTCVPMCQRHHSERHAHAGTFYPLNRDELRAWRSDAIARTQAAWERSR